MRKLIMAATFFLTVSSILVYCFQITILHYLLVGAAVLGYIYFFDACNGEESIWLFDLIAVGFLPLNIAFEATYFQYITILTSGPVGKVASCLIVYAILFSLEEIWLGVIGRFIWIRQEKDEVRTW